MLNRRFRADPAPIPVVRAIPLQFPGSGGRRQGRPVAPPAACPGRPVGPWQPPDAGPAMSAGAKRQNRQALCVYRRLELPIYVSVCVYVLSCTLRSYHSLAKAWERIIFLTYAQLTPLDRRTNPQFKRKGKPGSGFSWCAAAASLWPKRTHPL